LYRNTYIWGSRKLKELYKEFLKLNKPRGQKKLYTIYK
jgi:hypothetical protein